MIKPIVMWPDRRLHDRSTEVFVSDFEKLNIKELVQDMWDTMYAAGGVGLAAIQIGVPLRVCVLDVKKPYVLINPTITSSADLATLNEGCLSVPGFVEQLSRYTKVSVSYFDENGVGQSSVFEGMEAQAVQHEIDHLNGVVLPDKLGTAGRARLASKMAKKKEKDGQG